LHRALVAVVVALLSALILPATPVAAATQAKVVVVVGPVGSHNAHYKDDANDIVAEAKKYTSNVTKIFTPNATWSKVKAAAKGANVFVYLGHGNGWPSIYAPFQMLTKDGLGLDPSTGADGTKTVYYGEEYIRSSIRLAPNSVVLLYHLCYASGHTEPGLSQGTFAQAKERVDNYGAGFIGAGARAVFAEGHPSHPAISYMRQLFTTDRSMAAIFRTVPTWHDHLQGPYNSQRTPGLKYQLDTDKATPSGFYRSLIGDLSLTASKVTRTAYPDTGANPAAFVVPGAAEVTAAAGAPLFATPEAAADPAGVPSSTLPAATRLRLASEAAPSADGLMRVFGATVLGGSTSGFVRSTDIAPRDSAATTFRSFDQSNSWLSPNDDGTYDAMVLTPRFSESVTANYVVKNAAGDTVKSGNQVGDLVRFEWDLRTSAGPLVPDGVYTWALRGRDPWGNETAYKTGSFTVDGTPPVTKAAVASATAGSNGWIVSPVKVTLTATDKMSGVKSISWRVNDGTVYTYDTVATLSANGVRELKYRAVDKAGVRESWKSMTFRIDTKPPTVAVAYEGNAGPTAGMFRGAVTVKPTFDDATSGVASKTVAIDGGETTALTASSVVVDGEGKHTVVFGAKDAAGNAMTKSFSFTIDTTAPTVETPEAAEGAQPPTVTPNADGVTDSVSIPLTASEAVTVNATVTNAAAAVVRTFKASVPAGDQSLAWNGRDSAGKALPDGRYSVTLVPTDGAGNVGEAAAPVTVDVYRALSTLARTPAQFFPQDADTLTPKAKATWTLLAPATVTVEVRNASGAVVRTAYTDRALAAGAATWSWNGKKDDGTFAARGRYRIVVRATNGEQVATQSVSVLADAFKLTTSVTTAVRGKSMTITAKTSEPLSTTPVLVIREPGLTARTVKMTKVSSTTWTAKLTPKTSATPGTLTLKVKAKDSKGGANSSSVKLALK
jgi:flagellar hook assembly protein FlgD